MIIDGKEYEFVPHKDKYIETCRGCDCGPWKSELCFKTKTGSCIGGVFKLKKSTEWLTLDINNLPPDILVGDYEFECRGQDNDDEWIKSENDLFTTLSILKSGRSFLEYRYRKRQPAEPVQPSHEEIMTLWWMVSEFVNGEGGSWQKVTSYVPEENKYHIGLTWRTKDWFTNRKSATIPPEK